MRKLYNFITIDKPPYRWLVRENVKEDLGRSLIGQENRLKEQPAFKDNNARTLFFLKVPRLGEVFVKRYKLTGFWNGLKTIFGRSPSFNELKMANYLNAKNIPTVRPLAALEKKKWGRTVDSFLLIEKIEQSMPLKQFFTQKDITEETAGDRTRINQVLILMGELMRRTHQAEFFHQDLHIGNVLLTGSTPDEIRLHLIDLHRSRVVAGLSHTQKIFNLAQMGYSLSLVRPFADVVRFLKAYRQFDFRPEVLKKITRQVLTKIWQLRQRHLRSRAKRCLKNSSEFSIYQGDNYKVFQRRQIESSRLIDLVENHARLVRETPGELFKHSPARSISVLTCPVQLGVCQPGDKIFIKEYRYSLLSRLKNLGRVHAARRSWLTARGLVLRKILTPVALALVEPDGRWCLKKSYLCLKEVPGAQPSNELVVDFFRPDQSSADHWPAKKGFIKHLSRAIKNLHRQGVFHSDLKANNILVKHQSGKWFFYFLDLDRVDFLPSVELPQRIKNLAQLNAAMPGVITRADRLRFFNDYLNSLPPDQHRSKKEMIREIMKITLQRRHVWPKNFIPGLL
ncbi:MAG: hypothetical protein KAI63_01140 [Planctomycetes bacterium]|nr:hypothetical protein [Planctomycetota bacterium]